MRTSASLTALASALLVLASCGGGDNGNGGGGALNLSASSTTSINGVVGTTVVDRPSVKLTDANGAPKAGVAVSFIVESGNSTVTGGSQTTDANGVATVGSWRLDTIAGTNTLKANVAGAAGSPVVFTAVGEPGPVQRLAWVVAPATTVAPATPFNVVVDAVDRYGNRAPATTGAVTIALGQNPGGSTLTGPASVTLSSGRATFNGLSINNAGIAYTLVASLTSVGSTTRAFHVAAIPAYRVDLRYVGPEASAVVQSAFAQAVARWQQVITGDLSDIGLGSGTNGIAAHSCGEADFPAMQNETIDDIVIFAESKPIDGAGQVLGQAKPCYVRNSNHLTIIGFMKFDSADLETMVGNGSLNEVILHEMGHVFGFGTLWDSTSVTHFDTLKSSDPRWKLSGANGAWVAASGTGDAPVENCAQGVPTNCGAGTRLAHWREYNFHNELMTGYIASTGNPLSRITIASLADLGYTVNLNAADAYTVPVPLINFSGPAPQLARLGEEAYDGPIIKLDARGTRMGRLR